MRETQGKITYDRQSGQAEPKITMKRERTITLFFLILGQSPDSVVTSTGICKTSEEASISLVAGALPDNEE